MGEGIKIRTTILVDLKINGEVKQLCQTKKIVEGKETIKEEFFGDMIEERWRLNPFLEKKGISFDEFILTLK